MTYFEVTMQCNELVGPGPGAGNGAAAVFFVVSHKDKTPVSSLNVK